MSTTEHSVVSPQRPHAPRRHRRHPEPLTHSGGWCKPPVGYTSPARLDLGGASALRGTFERPGTQLVGTAGTRGTGDGSINIPFSTPPAVLGLREGHGRQPQRDDPVAAVVLNIHVRTQVARHQVPAGAKQHGLSARAQALPHGSLSNGVTSRYTSRASTSGKRASIAKRGGGRPGPPPPRPQPRAARSLASGPRLRWPLRKGANYYNGISAASSRSARAGAPQLHLRSAPLGSPAITSDSPGHLRWYVWRSTLACSAPLRLGHRPKQRHHRPLPADPAATRPPPTGDLAN